jgi:nitrate reductase cytochrome c-type subunit
MQMKKLIMPFCLLSMAAMLYGCGSSSKSGGSISSMATVGDTACVQCHSAAQDTLTGETIVSQYHKSAHYLSGQGCESCHGGGAQHNGVGPIPYAAPGAAQCATCHNGITAVATNSTEYVNSNHALLDLHYSATSSSPLCLRCHSHEGAVIFDQRGITGDKTFLTAPTTTSQLTLDRDGTKFKAINCQTCHEHGGALRAQHAQVSTTDSTRVAWDPNKNLKVDQFDLCTSCHTILANDGTTLVASGTVIAGRTAFYHNDRWTRMIATTHYDNPATGVGLATNLIEGYVIRTKGANPCFDCHGHEAKAATGSTTESTIHTDWAKSAHAGGLLNQKLAALAANPTRNDAQVDAILAAGVDATTGPAWEHYNWDDTASRGTCQRCHTATGASNFMTNPATYDKTGNGNSFTHLSGWTTTTKTSPQNELMYCWGCHTNAGTGTLRTPGAITETYSPATTGDPATTVAYPNVGNSNTCMTCHLGRESGDVIKNDQDADGVRGFVNSHYLAAGGTVFGKTGYTLGGRDYDSAAKGFVHDKLGVSSTGTAAADAYIASNGLSTSGPCAACHMTSEKLGVKTSHKYSPFSEYTPVAPAVTNDISLNPLCVTCHSTRGAGTDAKAVWFEGTWKARSDAALEALRVQLDANGMYFFEAHPYFYAGPGGTGGSFTNWAGVFGLAEWKDAMGTAFNYNLLKHDPGAVAHNRYYVRRLIYDSMDKLDNGILDYSVFATLNALDGTVATYKANAITFLINRGTADANVGTAAERF